MGTYFDSRCFTLSTEEVCNYFIWHQNDTIRNSISSVAQANFSQKQLDSKGQAVMKELLLGEKGIDWARDITPCWQRCICYRKLADG